MRIAIKFGYDGRQFHGYARQPGLRTVEGNLLQRLIENGCIDDIQCASIRTASRTDRGVSALGNVVAFNTDTSKKHIFQALNNGDNDIIVYAMTEVEPTFYPRYASWRIYSYYLPRYDLDVGKILAAAALFCGEHDFRNFARVETGKNPVRIINNITVTEQTDLIIIDFYAQTFLWHQIRRIVSALKKIGNEELEKEQITEALDNPDSKVDFGLAPAEPLILKDVIYDFTFDYNITMVPKINRLKKRILSSLAK